MKNTTLKQLVRKISYTPKWRMKLFSALTSQEQAEVLLRLSRHVQFDLVRKTSPEMLVNLLKHLEPDDATDIVQLLPHKKQEPVISQLNEQLRESVTMLLRFDPETAAGLMSVDYILVKTTETIAGVAKQVGIHERRTGKLPSILVVENGKLRGHLPGHLLGLARNTETVRLHVKKISSIAHNANYAQVIAHFRAHPHSKVVVTGPNDQILGVIYTDDILKALRDQESASLYDFAGVSDEETIFDSAKRKIRARYKWLMLNLGTSFLAAFTVGLFSETIAKHVLLASYMPIVAGMGGNSATQTLAVMVRGLSQDSSTRDVVLHTLKNELGAALVNGVLNGTIVFCILTLLNSNPEVGVVLGLALTFNLLIAATFGTIVPAIMKHLGKDPASSATIFITTATDVLGFLAFLGLATVLLD